MHIKHRTFLRAKEQRQVRQQLAKTPRLLHASFKTMPSGKVKVERVVLEDRTELLFIENELWLIIQQETLIPGLPALLTGNVSLPAVMIDMGAVPHIANGADVMTPGIVEFDEGLEEGDFVTIIDQQNRTPIAVGRLLKGGHEIRSERRGRAIKTLHYVGDSLWQLVKGLFD